MLCFLVSCALGGSSKSQGADLEQRLVRQTRSYEADANAGRKMCHKTGGCALRVTDLRKQHIRQACMAECDPKHKSINTTGHQPSVPPPTSVGTLATVALPSGAHVIVQGARVVGPTEAAALGLAAGTAVPVMATEATVATEVQVVGATEAAALVAAGAVRDGGGGKVAQRMK